MCTTVPSCLVGTGNGAQVLMEVQQAPFWRSHRSLQALLAILMPLYLLFDETGAIHSSPHFKFKMSCQLKLTELIFQSGKVRLLNIHGFHLRHLRERPGVPRRALGLQSEAVCHRKGQMLMTWWRMPERSRVLS